ncbi:MAG: type II toxin-antitoxin system VapC family toxin [Acidimicrobiaceae bacterium]|nr:type II toxin-antitoxin system VapC family toxin [Acidimicrobiaceae bacterium]MDE0497079.1 type II toxin-antitoxin system VapC family toxin [Acidimicrobiaceae bacterium]
MLLLDTNALLWALSDDPRLSDAARELIVEAWAAGAVAASAVTFWEVALLVERQRLTLPETPETWRQERIADGLVELPLHGEEVLRAVRLGDEGFHRDPADRFIVATALIGSHTLVTSDQQILAWPGTLQRVDSRGVDPPSSRLLTGES